MTVNFKKTRTDAKPPFRATNESAGADLCACVSEDINLLSGERLLVPTGIAVEIPRGYSGFLFGRSSLGKHGISLANSVGVIDSDYRGELQMLLVNHSEETFVIKNGDRLAQLVIMPIALAEFVEIADKTELSDTKRGAGGFGSTGN
ncbi:MAG: dUTP diphosphatase [Oscillospiraceae bacterium]|nr:dUTP diphosphatase [Oscillospiraceae bacterium]